MKKLRLFFTFLLVMTSVSWAQTETETQSEPATGTSTVDLEPATSPWALDASWLLQSSTGPEAEINTRITTAIDYYWTPHTSTGLTAEFSAAIQNPNVNNRTGFEDLLIRPIRYMYVDHPEDQFTASIELDVQVPTSATSREARLAAGYGTTLAFTKGIGGATAQLASGYTIYDYTFGAVPVARLSNPVWSWNNRVSLVVPLFSSPLSWSLLGGIFTFQDFTGPTDNIFYAATNFSYSFTRNVLGFVGVQTKSRTLATSSFFNEDRTFVNLGLEVQM